MIAIMIRELGAYFKTPIGYIFSGLFLLAAGLIFTFSNLLNNSSYYTSFLGGLLFLYLFAVPLLTMRLLSEERYRRTDQLLLTCPIKIIDIVIGKFFAALLVYLITLLVTVLYAAVVAVYGDLSVRQTFGGYIGFIMVGSCFISIGVFISALSENQIVAAFLTFFLMLSIWFINLVKEVILADVITSMIFASAIVLVLAFYFYTNTRKWLASGLIMFIGLIVMIILNITVTGFLHNFVSTIIGCFNLLDRYESFLIGIIRLQDLIYFLSFSSIFIFLTVRVIEKRRWV